MTREDVKKMKVKEVYYRCYQCRAPHSMKILRLGPPERPLRDVPKAYGPARAWARAGGGFREDKRVREFEYEVWVANGGVPLVGQKCPTCPGPRRGWVHQ